MSVKLNLGFYTEINEYLSISIAKCIGTILLIFALFYKFMGTVFCLICL
jgi:hypothetical protein